MTLEILIADDDPVVQHILGTMLEASGHSLLFASNGTECLAILSKRADSNNLPDVLFLDYLLPDMSGSDVLARIRNDMLLGKDQLPVILLSANRVEDLEELGMEVEPDRYLSKPFVTEDVQSMLAEVISGH